MKFYLASRFALREERYNNQLALEARGHEVTSRWITMEPDMVANHAKQDHMVEWALNDVHDVLAADAIVSFTEPPGDVPGRARGGRHVEHGIAIATGKFLFVVGPLENIFHHLPNTVQFDTWAEFLSYVEEHYAS